MASGKLTLIAGPCVIESREITFLIAKNLKKISSELDIDLVFKASFDKANRSSGKTFRGLGMDKGLNVLKSIKEEFGLKITTDIHDSTQANKVAEIVDVIQIPAFLCRQTDLINSAVGAIKQTNKVLNIKKGQFLAPWDMEQIVKKVNQAGLDTSSGKLWLTERGSSFGYNTLVVDFRSLPQMRKFNCPIIFDATHSVQQPGGNGNCSGGQREFVAPLARAASAVGVDGIFMEVHPKPDEALSDGPNMVPLHQIKPLLEQIISIRKILDHRSSNNYIK